MDGDVGGAGVREGVDGVGADTATYTGDADRERVGKMDLSGVNGGTDGVTDDGDKDPA